MNTSEQTDKIMGALKKASEVLARPPTRASGLRTLASLVLDSAEECAVWTGATAGQMCYPHVFVPELYRATGYGQVYGHRLVCEWVHGPAPTPGHQAAHSCGTTRCLNPRHLRWATPLENNSDKATHGTLLVGERNPSAKLTAADVAAMRLERQANGTHYKDIAEMYGVTTMTAYRAIVGQSWSGVAA